MKKHKRLWFAAVSMVLCIASPAVGQEEDAPDTENVAAPASGGPNLTLGGKQTAELGDWFWGLLADPVLLSGTTAIAADVGDSSVLYAGGIGYIAVSTDNGASWEETFRFSDLQEDEDEESDEENGSEGIVASAASEARADALREYLRRELEEQYDSDTADTLLDNITDEELLSASQVTDIEALRDLELDMDPDLSNVQLDFENVSGVSLSKYDSYIDRFIKLVNNCLI